MKRLHITIPFMCKTGLKIGKGLEMCMAIVEVVFVNMLMSIPCTYPVSSGTLSGRDERESASCNWSSCCVELANDVATSLDVMVA